MTYTIIYTRKVRVTAYESMNIGLHKECNEHKDPETAFKEVRTQVEKWIAEEQDRILAAEGRRPEGSPV